MTRISVLRNVGAAGFGGVLGDVMVGETYSCDEAALVEPGP